MTVIHDAAGVRLIHGDVSDPATIAGIPARSVQTIVTSPPYFGLRSYLPDGVILRDDLTTDERAYVLAELERLGIS